MMEYPWDFHKIVSITALTRLSVQAQGYGIFSDGVTKGRQREKGAKSRGVLAKFSFGSFFTPINSKR